MQLTLLTIVTNYYSQSSSPKHVGFHASASGAISVQRFTRRRCWTVASKSTSASTATSAERAIDAIVGPGPMCLARQKRVKWVVACGNMWIKLGIWLYMNHMNILCIIYVCIYIYICVCGSCPVTTAAPWQRWCFSSTNLMWAADGNYISDDGEEEDDDDDDDDYDILWSWRWWWCWWSSDHQIIHHHHHHHHHRTVQD